MWRQRCEMREECRQIALQDQHALVVDRAGHLDLALDVEQALLAGVGRGGHPDRKTEGMVAQVQHRQAVHLTGLFASHRQ